LESSINLIKGLIELGITKSIATPHIISDLYRNTAETINDALNILQNELKIQEILRGKPINSLRGCLNHTVKIERYICLERENSNHLQLGQNLFSSSHAGLEIGWQDMLMRPHGNISLDFFQHQERATSSD
jgi:hypothetical protein